MASSLVVIWLQDELFEPPGEQLAQWMLGWLGMSCARLRLVAAQVRRRPVRGRDSTDLRDGPPPQSASVKHSVSVRVTEVPRRAPPQVRLGGGAHPTVP